MKKQYKRCLAFFIKDVDRESGKQKEYTCIFKCRVSNYGYLVRQANDHARLNDSKLISRESLLISLPIRPIF